MVVRTIANPVLVRLLVAAERASLVRFCRRTAALGFAAWTMARESRLGGRFLLVTGALSIVIQGYYIFVVSCVVLNADLNTCIVT